MPLSSGKTVLIAEDTAAIRSILAYLLRSRGFEVIECADGQEALEKTLALRPDLVLLDVLMPRKQGFEVCSYLKANEDTRRIPILILTSITRDSGKDDDHWRRLSNADDFISKPFKAHDLLARIDRLMEDRKDTSRFEKRNEVRGTDD
jgi:twitching motility two-component system response regulator PilH